MNVQCPECSGIYCVELSDLGTEVECPNCASIVIVPSNQFDTGAIIGDFIILHKIATWEKGKVFAAKQISLNREIALKILFPPAEESDVMDFINEAREDASLDYPHIGQVFSLGEENGIYYYAMESIRTEDTNTRVFMREVIITKDHEYQNQINALNEHFRNPSSTLLEEPRQAIPVSSQENPEAPPEVTPTAQPVENTGLPPAPPVAQEQTNASEDIPLQPGYGDQEASTPVAQPVEEQVYEEMQQPQPAVAIPLQPVYGDQEASAPVAQPVVEEQVYEETLQPQAYEQETEGAVPAQAVPAQAVPAQPGAIPINSEDAEVANIQPPTPPQEAPQEVPQEVPQEAPQAAPIPAKKSVKKHKNIKTLSGKSRPEMSKSKIKVSGQDHKKTKIAIKKSSMKVKKFHK